MSEQKLCLECLAPIPNRRIQKYCKDCRKRKYGEYRPRGRPVSSANSKIKNIQKALLPKSKDAEIFWYTFFRALQVKCYNDPYFRSAFASERFNQLFYDSEQDVAGGEVINHIVFDEVKV
jgi:hypothetical protein